MSGVEGRIRTNTVSTAGYLLILLQPQFVRTRIAVSTCPTHNTSQENQNLNHIIFDISIIFEIKYF